MPDYVHDGYGHVSESSIFGILRYKHYVNYYYAYILCLIMFTTDTATFQSHQFLGCDVTFIENYLDYYYTYILCLIMFTTDTYSHVSVHVIFVEIMIVLV